LNPQPAGAQISLGSLVQAVMGVNFFTFFLLTLHTCIIFFLLKTGIFVFQYFIQHCHPSDSTVSEDAGIKPKWSIFQRITAQQSQPDLGLSGGSGHGSLDPTVQKLNRWGLA
jgi:hypothetical protein